MFLTILRLFYQLSTLVELTKTGVLPAALLAVLITSIEVLWRPPKSIKSQTQPDVCSTTDHHTFMSAKSQSIQQQIILTKETNLLITDATSNFIIAQVNPVL